MKWLFNVILLFFYSLPVMAIDDSYHLRIKSSLYGYDGDITKWIDILRDDKPEQYIPILINIAINDKSKTIRASSAFRLNEFYTSNGSKGYLYIPPLENNLSLLLEGLHDVNTFRFIIGIFEKVIPGSTYVACEMSSGHREEIVDALNAKYDYIQNLSNNFFENAKNGKWINEYNYAKNEIKSAVRNIRKCGK